MKVARSKKVRVSYVADFETTTDPEDCRVWGWGIVGVFDAEYEHVRIGHELQGFLDWIKDKDANIYFHNLRFDGVFIVDALLRDGYVVVTEQRKLEPGQIKTVIDKMGKFYSVTVCWKTGKTVEFRDSAKKLPMTLKRVAKAFNLEETKGEIDYHKNRPVGYRMTLEEQDYLRRDVVIIAKALRMEMEEGMTKLTVASDSMAEFKRIFGDNNFKRAFPVLPPAMDAEIRQSYRGGFTYADPRFSGKVQGSGIVLDVNSLYPHVMYSTVLPYGEPIYQRGMPELTQSRPLAIFSVTFTAEVKQDHIPCIQIKGQSMFGATEYLSRIREPVTLWVTSVDWKLWNDHYNIEVLSYNGGWSFRGSKGFFKNYIDKWMEVKATTKGGKREIAKLHLNSLYGKFGSNPDVTGKIPMLVDNRVRLILGKEESRAPVYTAMAAFVTAYARDLTIRAAQANYAVFAYADTDSLHLLTDELPDLDVHPSNLGAWKLEYHFQHAMYVRAKFYLEQGCTEPDGSYAEYVNRVAGMPEEASSALTFDAVYHGNKIGGKKTPLIVPGGVVLREGTFTINL
jgi:hypothetical protein